MKLDETMQFVSKMVINGSLVVLCGPTSSGKDTLLREMTKIEGVAAIVSHTTRPKRRNETDGVDYHFVNEANILERTEDFVEINGFKAHGQESMWLYALSKKEAARNGVAIMNYKGYQELKLWRRKEGLSKPILVYVEVPRDVAFKRYSRRKDEQGIEEFERRWEDDKKWLSLAKENADFIIYNFKIEEITT